MTVYRQGMYSQDPAQDYENRQNYDLSKPCYQCIHHESFDGRRICRLKGLRGNSLSMCGEFRSKTGKAGIAELEKLFIGAHDKQNQSKSAEK